MFLLLLSANVLRKGFQVFISDPAYAIIEMYRTSVLFAD